MTDGRFELNPASSPELQKGDLVEVLLGPAIGKTGLVHTIQHGNGDRVAEDTEATHLRIGVGLVEPIDVAPELVAILRVGDLLPLDEAPQQEVTRWFNDPSDLRLLVRDGSDS